MEELSVLEMFLTSDFFDNITGEEKPDGISDFAGEKFQMLLDYANSPYIDFYRDSAGINILRDVCVRNTLHLMGEDYYIIPDDRIPTGVREPVKLVVNTSDLSCLFCQDDLDTLMEMSGTGVKSLNLFYAGIKAAVAESMSNGAYAVGVLASPELYLASKFESMIRDAFLQAGVNEKVQIFQQLSTGIQESVEGDPRYYLPDALAIRDEYAGPILGTSDDDIDINMMDRYGFQTSQNSLLLRYSRKTCTDIQLNSPGNYARFNLVTLIEKHRRSGSHIPIQAIILGDICDTFVLDTLKSVVDELYNFSRDGQYIYRNSISPDLVFINPVECLVKECYKLLRKEKTLAFNTSRTDVTSFLIIPSPTLTTDKVDSLSGVFSESFKHGRKPGQENSGEKMIPFSMRYLPSDSFISAKFLFPEATKQINKKLY